MANHPDTQKIRIIGFLLGNRQNWQFEVEKNYLFTAILGNIYFGINKKYKSADKSLARPGRKQANVSVRMA